MDPKVIAVDFFKWELRRRTLSKKRRKHHPPGQELGRSILGQKDDKFICRFLNFIKNASGQIFEDLPYLHIGHLPLLSAAPIYFSLFSDVQIICQLGKNQFCNDFLLTRTLGGGNPLQGVGNFLRRFEFSLKEARKAGVVTIGESSLGFPPGSRPPHSWSMAASAE